MNSFRGYSLLLSSSLGAMGADFGVQGLQPSMVQNRPDPLLTGLSIGGGVYGGGVVPRLVKSHRRGERSLLANPKWLTWGGMTRGSGRCLRRPFKGLAGGAAKGFRKTEPSIVVALLLSPLAERTRVVPTSRREGGTRKAPSVCLTYALLWTSLLLSEQSPTLLLLLLLLFNNTFTPNARLGWVNLSGSALALRFRS